VRRERGIAALTAILIVAVAASAAAMMLSQQSAMLDQTLLVASRAQAEQYATAGVDWARGVLVHDARQSSVDSLNEGWAQPIVGLPVERAVVAGTLSDEQGKFNLNNLVEKRPSDADIKVFQNLLTLLELPSELARNAADFIDPNASDAYYLGLARPYRAARGARYATVDELYRVRGFDARAVEKLRPYVTALPDEGRKAVNANTAPDVVLAAVLDVDRSKVKAIVAERDAKPFDTKTALADRIRQSDLRALSELDVRSDWFAVRVTVQQDDVQLGTEALLRRRPPPEGTTSVVWRRPVY
jgi:general secretion pathway protein K